MTEQQPNPMQMAEGEAFKVGELDLNGKSGYSGRMDFGALLLCRKGKIELSIDDLHCTLRRNTSVMILPGSMVSLTSPSDDLRISYFAFSAQLFAEAAFRLDIDFMRIIKQYPFHNNTLEEGRNIDLWLRILEHSYRDTENRFRNTITRNRLQNALLEAYDRVLRHSGITAERQENSSRRQELFTRFISLVQQHASGEREVAFYAEQLCISTRYLSTIVHAISGHTAKEIIDHTVILEIKMLLRTTDLSVQEIAYRLRFPDQSYLGRFFRKHVGQSPSEFRLENK